MHRLERTLRQLRQIRHRFLVTQQRLRRRDDQRLPEQANHLAAQQVEHLRRRGRLDHLHVVVRAQLQETLDTRRRVLRTLAFVAVRQEHRETRHAAPLHFARRDELVDHDLRAVHEVTELRFPRDERIRFSGRIAVLEAEHRFFRQHRVDHVELGLAFRDVLQRNVGAVVPALAVLVVQNGVTVRERAAARVLARQAHRITRCNQRRECQMFAHAPVELRFATAHRATIVDHALDQRMHLEVLAGSW